VSYDKNIYYFPTPRLGLSVTTPGGSSGAPDSGRHNSLEDINLDQFLKTSNYEDTVKQLDIYYGIGEALIYITLQLRLWGGQLSTN